MKSNILLLCLVLVGLSTAQDCQWRDPFFNNDYDLSFLGKPKEHPYRVFDSQTSGMFDIEYEFNFCTLLPKQCKGQEASAIEFLDVYDQQTDTCEVLGQTS